MASKDLHVLKKLGDFVGSVPVRNLGELFDNEFAGETIVGVWFDSVVEGVDMWFSDEHSKDMPKFRMRMRVKHGDNVAIFSVFDKDIEKRDDADFDDLPSFKVASVCNEANVVNMFFDEYFPHIDDHFEGIGKELNKDLVEGQVAYYSSCESKEGSNCGDVSSLCSKIIGKEVSSGTEAVGKRVVFSPDMRKSCVKRKLEFDDNVVDGVANNKVPKSSKSD
ncbi:hypothetical protein TSUD_58370 [Trifolium subterraneum]|uniref:Uncharacterized protein n=1 Tax=Trifolium subterraneum TaxID=3900 RepID=A0A2Z6MGN4_TRISU|nr:hypothetical protein TSUD_58370 [Trifolium subterraneum]